MISDLLLTWYEVNKRDLPWRNTKSPYKIWLSEVILQQTRVNQGLHYYCRFVDRYPTVEDLAAADLDEVLKLWQGLGYYTRARNLHSTAVSVVRDHGGAFPSTYEQLSRLKGIGPYTAAAVASFAFHEPVPLTDGNVYRLLSRLFDIDTPINTGVGKKLFVRLVSEILDQSRPDIFNQAIMEFGALVCTPRNPLCSTCVLSRFCKALQNQTVNLRPVKKYSVKNKIRYLNYLVITFNNTTWIRKRNETGIWNSLYEFPMVETTEGVNFEYLSEIAPWKSFLGIRSSYKLRDCRLVTHKLSHQLLNCTFFRVESDIKPCVRDEFMEISLDNLHKYAVPRVIERYISELT